LNLNTACRKFWFEIFHNNKAPNQGYHSTRI
jgi:hypothetical protein